MKTEIDLKSKIREVPDFPEPGVGFKDIAPLLGDPAALRQAVARAGGLDGGAEARSRPRRRGARLLARRRDRVRGRVRVRPGTPSGQAAAGDGLGALRARVRRERARGERRPPSSKGARVVIHDDVLATGGTVKAIAGLVEQLGGTSSASTSSST